jgi:hypothetical protein
MGVSFLMQIFNTFITHKRLKSNFLFTGTVHADQAFPMYKPGVQARTLPRLQTMIMPMLRPTSRKCGSDSRAQFTVMVLCATLLLLNFMGV